MHRSRVLRSLGISRATIKHILESLLGEREAVQCTAPLLLSTPLNIIDLNYTPFRPSFLFSPLLSHYLVFPILLCVCQVWMMMP